MSASAQNPLIKQACNEVLDEIEEAKDGCYAEVQDRSWKSWKEAATSYGFGILMDCAGISTVVNGVSLLTKSEKETYDIQDEMIILQVVRSQVASELK